VQAQAQALALALAQAQARAQAQVPRLSQPSRPVLQQQWSPAPRLFAQLRSQRPREAPQS
jgi:hypothetical protein